MQTRDYAAENQAYLDYQSCIDRLNLASTDPDYRGLRKRWPTLADCVRDMQGYYEAMGADHQAYADDLAQRDLNLMALR